MRQRQNGPEGPYAGGRRSRIGKAVTVEEMSAGSKMFFELFLCNPSLLEDAVQGSGRYFPVHRDNATNGAVDSAFLKHHMAAALPYRFKSNSFERFYNFFA